MWTWIYLAALVVSLAALAGAGVIAGRRTLQFFRDLRAVQRAIFDALDRLANAAERVAERAEEVASTDAVRLQRSLARLRHANARLAVLRAAIAEVQDSFAAVTAWVPRK